MAKVKNSIWGIFAQGVKLYFSNFGSFFKYLAFPVFGQILGIILTLVAAYFYALNLPKYITQDGLFDNFSMIFLILIVIILPGLLIFTKALWEYLVAYGAVNSMVDNMLKSGKVYDFPAHTQLITRRTGSFVGLWLLLGLFGILGAFPLFWVIAGILFVYFVLIFQVFTFEPDKSPLGCFQKSTAIIKGNFARTLGLIVLLGILTYWILPDLVEFLFDFLNILSFLAIPIDTWANQLPIDEINKMLAQTSIPYQITSLMIAKSVVSTFLDYIVICLTLPLRSICWALWYKNLNKAEMKLDKRILERAEGKE